MMTISAKFLAWMWTEAPEHNLAAHQMFDDIEMTDDLFAFSSGLPESASQMMQDDLDGHRRLYAAMKDRYKPSFMADEPYQTRLAIKWEMLRSQVAGKMAKDFLRAMENHNANHRESSADNTGGHGGDSSTW